MEDYLKKKKEKATHHRPGLLSSVSGASSGAERVSRPLVSSYNPPSGESWTQEDKKLVNKLAYLSLVSYEFQYIFILNYSFNSGTCGF